MMSILDLAYIIVGYIIGAIPTGFLFARMFGIHDIRVHGSGNIGATNIARILGKQYFLLIFVLDAAKAFLYLWLLQQYAHISAYALYLTACAILLGNVTSIFLKGRGGKGVSTAVGIMLAVQPYVIPWVLCVWLITLLLTKTVGIASVIAALSLPVIGWIISVDILVWVLMLVISFVICMRHAQNIKEFFKAL